VKTSHVISHIKWISLQGRVMVRVKRASKAIDYPNCQQGEDLLAIPFSNYNKQSF